MKKPKLRELGEAVRAVITGPYTVNFPRVPSPVAPSFRGIMVFEEDKCVVCGACAEVCPAAARELTDVRDTAVRRITHHQERCIYCGLCEAACFWKAIRHTEEYDLAQLTNEGYERSVEKELILCEICGEPIAARQHLLWIAKATGELAYANPTLAYVLHQEIEGVEPTLPTGARTAYRSDHIRPLCPTCRREVYLREIWGY
jgi:hydrogenase-4 component H